MVKQLLSLSIFCCVLFFNQALLESVPYSVDTYNELPHFLFTAQNGFDKRIEISELKQVFIDHDVNKFIGLHLLHKHFDLNENEKLVEIINNNNVSVAKPIYMIEEQVLDGDVIPYRFKVTKECDLIPLEYSLSNKENNANLEIRYQMLKTLGSDFITKIAELLHKMNLMDTFGIGIINRDHISSNENCMIESSNNDQRELVSRLCLSDANQCSFNNHVNYNDDTIVAPAFWRFGFNDIEDGCSHS